MGRPMWPAALAAVVVLASVPAWSETYAYDTLGRLILVVSDSGAKTQYSYDAAGNRQTVATSSGSARAPIAVDDNVNFNYGATSQTYYPLANDSDPNSQTLSLVGVTPAIYGTVAISGSALVYTPPGSTSRAVGTDSFAYTIQNTSGLTASAVMRVTLGYAQPTANPDSASVTNTSSVTLDPRANDSDPAGNPLTVTGVGSPSHGSVSFSSSSVTYTPTTAYSGSDSFTYSIANGVGGSASSTVSITVTGASLTASASDWNWYQYLSSSPTVSPATGAGTCTATGGSAPYTYLWQYVSGDTVITAGSPNGSSTAWSGRTSGSYGVTYTASWRCKVTDNLGAVAYSNGNTVSFERDNGN